MGGGEVGGGSTTPTRACEPGAVPSDWTPAKRPATIAGAGGPPEDGPEMPTVQMSEAICALQRKLISVEDWATSVNAALVDHAGHIDTSRMSATQVSNQLDATGDQTDLFTTNLLTTSRDLVNFAQQADSNHAFLKQQVAAVVELLGMEVQKLSVDRAKDIVLDQGPRHAGQGHAE